MIHQVKSIIYPGTFDPITNGHVDLVTRASKIFDNIVVAVSEHTSKKTLLSFKERISLTQQSLENISNVTVLGFQNLLVDFARDQNIFLILRGIRAIADFEYERQLSSMNHHLAPEIETVFMAPQEKYAHISSTFVRDIARLGGDVSAFVPQVVSSTLQRK
jgi:pantetheine-phosphate adenylyltransferase